jgi:electron transfer flavoprotein beta subunit
MNLYVALKMVPDTVEELNVASDNRSLEAELLRFKLSDPDEHALEQALLLKEKHGGTVTVVALDAPELDEVLFTALAKGANRAVKIPVNQTRLGTATTAKVLASFFNSGSATVTPDTLILPGSQATDDFEGELAPYLAESLQLPCVAVVSGVALEDGGRTAVVLKEFAGGLRGEFSLPLPAVLGIQSAEQPPRYVPIAKVRAAMKTAKIETVSVPPPETLTRVPVERMYKPEVTLRAQMLEGAPEEVADQLLQVLAKHSLI